MRMRAGNKNMEAGRVHRFDAPKTALRVCKGMFVSSIKQAV